MTTHYQMIPLRFLRSWMLPLPLLLMGVSTCQKPDHDGDGWTTFQGDCDDSDPETHPQAPERCDGRDNDCDGWIDEDLPLTRQLFDQDGDGFGAEIDACLGSGSPVSIRGDCDDHDPDAYPGAPDAPDDGIDQDCGGHDGPQPSVGLDASGFTSIQAALNASLAGDTVWVGSGTYEEHDLTFRGKAVRLASTHFADLTVIDAQSLGSVVVLNAGEGPDTVLDGFTLTGGLSGTGGGMYLRFSSPALTNLTLQGNQASIAGGAMYLENSSPSLTNVRIEENQAFSDGGGMYLNASSPTLTGVAVEGNQAGWGGGGMALSASSPTLTNLTISGNQASFGGGMRLSDSSPSLTAVSLSGNKALIYEGGGMHLVASSPTLTNVTIVGNQAATYGGGMYLDYSSSPILTQVAVIGNAAALGGGLYTAYASNPRIVNSLLAWNAAFNLYSNPTTAGAPTVLYSDLYAPPELANHNLASLDATNLTVDPQLAAYTNDGDSLDDDLHLQPDSPLRDAGDPSTFDPDGSRADVGVYGGAGADFRYYQDADGDGMYDGWETAHGLDTGLSDGAEDLDGDGLTNVQELETGTDPHRADSDGDGSADGAEVAGGADPLDWYSQPGVPEVVAQVPEDFATVQQAIDAGRDRARIEVGPGEWPENLVILGKTVKAFSRDGAELTALNGTGGRVVFAVGAHLELRGFTVTGGKASSGAGMYLISTDGLLEDLSVAGNQAGSDTDSGSGGGMYLVSSSLNLTQVTIEGNQAPSGGGIALFTSSATLNSVRIQANQADLSGGGMYLNGSSPTLNMVSIEGNQALSGGGGMYQESSSPLMTNVRVEGNQAQFGGGMYLASSSPTLSNVVIARNRAEHNGGGIYLYSGNATLANVVIDDNQTTYYGGGMYLYASSPTLTQVAVIGNAATSGAGLYLNYSSSPRIVNSLLAWNAASNLYNDAISPGAPTVLYSDLYAPPGWSNHNLASLDATNLTVDPQLVAYSNDGDPLDDDLHLQPDSPLRDAGDPSTFEPDGSRADIGVYGGPGADLDYYQDADGDGMYDGWETAHGLDPVLSDGAGDLDGDGLTNVQEFETGTDPQRADSDGDGSADGAEVAGGADPLDWYSQPGVPEVVARVPEDFATIQAAVDAGRDKARIEVGPGEWPESLVIVGKAVELWSREGADLTVLNGNGGRVIFAVGAHLELRGFTVTGGKADSGAGMYLTSTDGLLEDLSITGNLSRSDSVNGAGGGMYLVSSNPTLSHVRIEGNEAYYGGGMYLYTSSPTLNDVSIEANQSSIGGGMYLETSNPVLTSITIEANQSSIGGGMYLATSSPGLYMSVVARNQASAGGGIYLYLSNPTLTNTSLTENRASGNYVLPGGGGMYLDSSSPTLTNVTIDGNQGDFGGGMYLLGSSPTLTQVAVIGNAATSGGGLYLNYSSSPRIVNSLLAWNAAFNLYSRPTTAGAPTVLYSDLYAPPGWSNHNLASLDATNLTVDPQLVAYTNDGDPLDDDLHLQPDSPLRDAGDPSTFDPDGSRADIGVYGGPGADLDYYQDADGDGMYDGWETAHGLDPVLSDGAGDLDGDGLTNVQEFETGTDPQRADSDGDGSADGAEVAGGADPLDWYSQPGVPEVVARVPEDFATIQAAVDAGRDKARIEVGPGEWPESLVIVGKAVTLRALEDAQSTILIGSGGTVISAFDAYLELRGLTITQGSANYGGGLYLSNTDGVLEDLVISANRAANSGGGGGVYLDNSSPTLNNVTIEKNKGGWGGGLYLVSSSPMLDNVMITGNGATASHREGRGGGMYLDNSSPTLTHVMIDGNGSGFGGGMALQSSSPSLIDVTIQGGAAHTGGGMYLNASSPTLTRVTITGNQASGGGGMYLASSSPLLTGVTLSGNTAFSGGGMYLSSSSPTLVDSTVSGNQAGYVGGGMALWTSSSTLVNVTIVGNQAATYGGGMYLDASTPTLTQVAVVGNLAASGGGLYLNDSASPRIVNSLLAWNAAFNLYSNPTTAGAPTVLYSDLYAPPEVANHNLTSLDATNLTVDPQLAAYTNDGDPHDDDLHLQPDSPLRDAGDPSTFDPDGSRADIGVYGGAGADFRYYQDADGDGMYDGWETAHGLNPGLSDGAGDPDGDGLTNVQEFGTGTDPHRADSDGDGSADGAEVAGGADPLDWYSQPGVPEVVAQVPEDFATVQQAIDAGRTQAQIEVGPGQWQESLAIIGRTVKLWSREGAGSTALIGNGDRVLFVVGGRFELRGFTVTQGTSAVGGGVALFSTDGVLEDLLVTNNGGSGIYLFSSSPTLSHITLAGNVVPNSSSGGGIYLDNSSPSLTDVAIVENQAEDGAGMYLNNSSPTLTEITIERNQARNYGGGMFLVSSSPTLTNVLIERNQAQFSSGGGMYLSGSRPILTNVEVVGNQAGAGGGGMRLDHSSPTLTNVTVLGNLSTYGAGVYLYDSSPTLANVTIVGNQATDMGGGILMGSSNPTLMDVIAAYNTGFNLYQDSSSSGSPTLSYVVLFAPTGQSNYAGITASATTYTYEPGFLKYDASGAPVDLHLALSSPAVDAGDPTLYDPDGTRSDLGAYGGAYGDEWDRDGDGFTDYFWPGTIDDAPAGIDPGDYDADDRDPVIH